MSLMEKVRRIGGSLYRRAENLLAAMLFVMFAAFLVQIAFRYLWLSWQVLRGDAPDEFDPTKAGSGV